MNIVNCLCSFDWPESDSSDLGYRLKERERLGNKVRGEVEREIDTRRIEVRDRERKQI